MIVMTETDVLVSDQDQDLRDVEEEAGASHFRDIRWT